MDTGKIPFGSEIWLIVKNPLWGDKCPCCGHKPPKKGNKWLVVEGIYYKMESDGDNVYYFAEYYDEYQKKYKDAWINKRYMGDIIDSPLNLDDKNYRPSEFDVYSKDIDICEYLGEFDGVTAFHTKEEAEQYIEEYGEYLEG